MLRIHAMHACIQHVHVCVCLCVSVSRLEPNVLPLGAPVSTHLYNLVGISFSAVVSFIYRYVVNDTSSRLILYKSLLCFLRRIRTLVFNDSAVYI